MSRALLVIDVQNEYFSGALPITHPVGHLKSITRAMDVAAEHHVPTVVIRHHMADTSLSIFQHGSPEWQLHDEVEGRPRQKLIDKQLPGSFTNTDLNRWLDDNGIDTIAISGYMTHMCCDTTARQAVHLGKTVEFLSDATGTLPLDNSAGTVTAEELQRATLCAQQMLLSEVLTSETWFGRL